MDYDPRVSARAAESGSREALVAYQAEQLQRTMKLVAASPYWNARFKETGFDPASITHPDELYAAPTLDKHQYAAALAVSADLWRADDHADPDRQRSRLDHIPDDRNIGKTR